MGYRKLSGEYAFYIETIGVGTATANAPKVVVGKVVPKSTADREPTQNPMSGFVCDGTPLGKGHLIALFLGGPDIAENYAPQYEQWQQGGAWKNMELAMKSSAGSTGTASLYMVVELEYGNTGNVYGAEKQKFANCEYLTAWTDYRIPTRFKVSSFLSTATGAAAVIADLFGTDDPKGLAALKTLPSQGFLTAVKDFQHDSIPDEDYKYWLKIMLRHWSIPPFEKAKQDYEGYVVSQVVAATTPAPSTGPKGVSKPPPSKRSVQPAIEEKGRLLYGFKDNPNLGQGKWQLANTDKIAAYVKDQLDSRTDHFGVRNPDYVVLTGTGAGAAIAQALQ